MNTEERIDADSTEAEKKSNLFRFHIEKLEERIAPWCPGKVNPHGKCVGPGHKPPFDP